MNRNTSLAAHELIPFWQMPLTLNHYDQSPLSEKERWALEQCAFLNGSSTAATTARKLLARFEPPISDVFRLRYRGRSCDVLYAVHRFMRREMQRRGKMFWEWEPEEWLDMLQPTAALFQARYGKWLPLHVRVSMIDSAYLLGNVSDLRSVGIEQTITKSAKVYFGADLIEVQYQRVLDALSGKGYKEKSTSILAVRQALCMLFALKRTPYLEDISEEWFAEITSDHHWTGSGRNGIIRLRVALESLGILPPEQTSLLPHRFNAEGMVSEWHEWCVAWHDQTVDLPLDSRRNIISSLLATGRWLYEHAPDVCAPEQWTEDLALRFRIDLCSWTVGQYASEHARQHFAFQRNLDKPMSPKGIFNYLTALRRYFTDLTSHAYIVGGAPARKITLHFSPKEALATPAPVKRAIDEANPRDIDMQVWAKLAIAAATLAESDLPHHTKYPLSFWRAVGLVWVTSARRPNEIMRLRLNCLREDWDPEMRDEKDDPIPLLPSSDVDGKGNMFYLHIPSGKNRGSFWIWIPDYVADAIQVWQSECPHDQKPLLDQKDREKVDYLFCYKNMRVGKPFINRSLIPTLCSKAGVDCEDAKGRITGHRGRSSRLTLLRHRGVSLEDLAEYAGHTNTHTIRKYVKENPILLHRVIRDADDLSRIIEGVVDLQAAAAGLPALRWFIGYDTDGEPMYCGNQTYVTCPHRLGCERCGMFIGGEKAQLLHKGEGTLPVTSKVPMTSLETCVVNGDEAGTAACQEMLRQASAPETPDIHLIFNPEGLSNHELEKLAQLGTTEALEKLRQALDAHQMRLSQAQQHKTGHSALVGAQRKRITFIQGLVTDCEQRRDGSRNNPNIQAL